MYFHTDSESAKTLIAVLADMALENGESLRIDVDSRGTLKMKRGGEMWTAPIYSTPDPYRD